MVSYENNVYYRPERSGLSIFGEINLDYAGNYEGFELFVIWCTADGKFVWGRDNGCSCPAPFEDTEPGDLKVLESLAQFEELVRGDSCYRQANDVDVVQILERLHAAGLR